METANDTCESVATLADLIAEAARRLAAAGVETARLDAEVLIAHACGLTRSALYARLRAAAPPRAQGTFEAMLARRTAREPLQYIVGHQEFWSLDFSVTPDVLIPRPETELLVELALEVVRGRAECRGDSGIARGGVPIRRASSGGSRTAPTPLAYNFTGLTLCDLGTGSGCIAIALARELPEAEVWALDVSLAALGIAQANAQRHGLTERVRCVEGDLFATVRDVRFDVVVSNPPYLSLVAASQCQPELAWEPRQALQAGDRGLDIIERVLANAPDQLADGGWLLMEIGADQEVAVGERARAARFRQVAVQRDYAGLPRVLLGQV